MTIEEFETRADEIRKLSAESDHEAAHSNEDALSRDVLIAIVERRVQTRELARRMVALLAEPRPRHCA